MRNTREIALVSGISLQALGMALFVPSVSSAASAFIFVIGSILALFGLAQMRFHGTKETFSLITTLVGLGVLLAFSFFGVEKQSSIVMALVYCFGFAQMFRGEKREKMQISDATYEMKSGDPDKGRSGYSITILDEEKQKIYDELDALEKDISEADIIHLKAPRSSAKILFAKKNGKTYHSMDCRLISAAGKDELSLLKSKEDAKAKGLRPCGVCRP